MTTTERSASETGVGQGEGLAELLARAEELVLSARHAEGVGLARQAVRRAQEASQPQLLARAFSLQALHEFRLGEAEVALPTLHRALALFTEQDDPIGMSQTLNGMVIAYHALGLQEEALDNAVRSLEAAKRSRDQLTLAWAYNRPGISHAAVGNVPEGIASLEFALTLARDARDEVAVFAALNNLIEDLNTYVRALRREGEEEGARQRLAQAMELAPEALAHARGPQGNPYEEAIILLTHAQTLVLAGEGERARGDAPGRGEGAQGRLSRDPAGGALQDGEPGARPGSSGAGHRALRRAAVLHRCGTRLAAAGGAAS